MKYSLTLKQIINETPEVKSFVFIPDQRIDYQAGQFLKWSLLHDNPDNRSTVRYFTIASAPSENQIRLTTRFAGEKSSSFKSALLNLKPGDKITAEGPHGDFVLPATSNQIPDITFIAGGIGITPFRAILKDLDSKQSLRPIGLKNFNPDLILIYANRDDNFPFKAELDELSAEHPNLKINYIVGPITKEILNSELFTLNSELIYVSGPEPMVESLGQTLIELGIVKDNIKQDFFPGYTE